MQTSLLLIFLIVFVGIILFILEFIYPLRKISNKELKKSVVTNLLVALLNNLILFSISITFLYSIASNFSSFGLLNYISSDILKFILALIIMDIGIYFWHRLNHKIPFLWMFHKTHHSDLNLNTTTGFRFHIGELLLSYCYKAVFIIIFGIPVSVVLISETLVLLFSLFHHTNLNLKFDRFFSNFIITPRIHQTHHSTRREEHDSNYGVTVIFWDQLFKTLNLREPKKIGLEKVSYKNLFEFFKFGFKYKY